MPSIPPDLPLSSTRRVARLGLTLVLVAASTACSGEPFTEPSTCHALELDGTDDWVRVPDHPALDGIAPLTIEAWVRPDGYPGEVQIVSHHDHGLHTGYVLLIFGGGQMQFRYQFAGDNHSFGYTDVAEGQWHHVAATYELGEARLFVDGEERQNGGIGDGVAEDFDGPLAIGRTAAQDGFYFQGLIDEVRISKVARYEGDFIPEHKLQPDSGSVALWRFEGTGQTVKDLAGGHDGTLGATANAASDDPKRVEVPCEH